MSSPPGGIPEGKNFVVMANRAGARSSTPTSPTQQQPQQQPTMQHQQQQHHHQQQQQQQQQSQQTLQQLRPQLQHHQNHNHQQHHHQQPDRHRGTETQAQHAQQQQQHRPQQIQHNNTPAPQANTRHPPAPNGGGGGGGGGGMRELRVEDALLYLDDVKKEFGDRPRVYNEFLAIMKNFKSQEVDTPGVIARVSKLFRGYNTLILGFNKFLPEGYKITIEDLVAQNSKLAAAEREATQSGFSKKQDEKKKIVVSVGTDQLAGSVSTIDLASQESHQNDSHLDDGKATRQYIQKPAPNNDVSSPQHIPLVQSRANGSQDGTSPSAVPHPQASLTQQVKAKSPQRPKVAAPQPPQHQAVEFDHAISYVTTIKRRFANDPSTYHSFLEILHTYQKEQRGIKEVLEQVAHLFQDHPDLLKEFTFFLPDAVQEQAKERLHRAAADSEARQAQAAQAQLEQQHEAQLRDRGSQQRLIDMTSGQIVNSEPDTTLVGLGRKRPLVDSSLNNSLPHTTPQQPESYTYNAAVERQFFDAVREALSSFTRDGGQAWAEFLKCLDMYAQEILSRTEMLNFVEPLLGKRNTKLFEEFKHILTAAGSQQIMKPSLEDSWHSVPLSEIDFSRCRRCTPSYRALPRDYPSPPCSERSDEEQKVLNDVWVSLPVGSEESYTFRHMRRNNFEEVLFRCEDERFEIDMVIDSNFTTLRRLEPIAKEITLLAESDFGVDQGNGIGGLKFKYAFDKSILGVVHKNSIARIYGDAGQEMLDLMVTNPTCAIPVVIARLREKDTEWRAVRQRLNRHWKELASANYYKSLDHRSLTWRTTDKRAISTRTLVAEIKDRAANHGQESKASADARLDKAKEEHGSFFAVTKGSKLSRKVDLTNLPKPDYRLFTPHMSLVSENNSWAQHDAYRILSFALERGSMSSSDKERCHRLWTALFGSWFSVSSEWMQKPASSYVDQPSGMDFDDGQSSMADEEIYGLTEDGTITGQSSSNVVDADHDRVSASVNGPTSSLSYHPIPSGSIISTLYGQGQVIEHRMAKKFYVVKFAFGTGYLRHDTIFCSIIVGEQTANDHDPFAVNYRMPETVSKRSDDMMVIGTQSLYLFFRLHHILIRRLGIAKRLAYNVKDDMSLKTLVEQMPGCDDAHLGRRRYDAYLSLVYALLDGGIPSAAAGNAAEGGKYEDRVRSLLGHGGFELATMDKLIAHILKNMQAMGNDSTMWNLVRLFLHHKDLKPFCPIAFRDEAALLTEGEVIYAFHNCSVGHGKDKSVLHIESLGVISGQHDDASTTPSLEAAPAPKRPKRER